MPGLGSGSRTLRTVRCVSSGSRVFLPFGSGEGEGWDKGFRVKQARLRVCFCHIRGRASSQLARVRVKVLD